MASPASSVISGWPGDGREDGQMAMASIEAPRQREAAGGHVYGTRTAMASESCGRLLRGDGDFVPDQRQLLTLQLLMLMTKMMTMMMLHKLPKMFYYSIQFLQRSF